MAIIIVTSLFGLTWFIQCKLDTHAHITVAAATCSPVTHPQLYGINM